MHDNAEEVKVTEIAHRAVSLGFLGPNTCRGWSVAQTATLSPAASQRGGPCAAVRTRPCVLLPLLARLQVPVRAWRCGSVQRSGPRPSMLQFQTSEAQSLAIFLPRRFL